MNLLDIVRSLGPAGLNTVILTVICYPLAICVAIVAASIRLSRIPVLSQVTAIGVDFNRITPILVQIVFVFYGLPLVGIRLDPWPSAIATLAIHVGSYQSEILRSAYLSVPKRLSEAAVVLGMPGRVRVWRIVMPIALRVAIPPMATTLLDTFRSTVVVSVIGVSDIIFRSQEIIQETMALGRGIETTPVLMVVMAFFVGIGYPAARLIRTLERRVALP